MFNFISNQRHANSKHNGILHTYQVSKDKSLIIYNVGSGVEQWKCEQEGKLVKPLWKQKIVQ